MKVNTYPVYVRRRGRKTEIDWKAVNNFLANNYDYDPEEHREHLWGAFDTKGIREEVPEYVFRSESDRHLLLTVYNDWFVTESEQVTIKEIDIDSMLPSKLDIMIDAQKMLLSSMYGAFVVRPSKIYKGNTDV